VILYEGRCRPCDKLFDDVMSVDEFSENGLTCPDCGQPAERYYGHGQPAGISGPLPSKPLVIKHAGLEFTSKSQIKQYEAENPGARMLTKDDSSWRSHHDKTRAKAESRAKARGFRDYEDQCNHQRRERDRKNACRS